MFELLLDMIQFTKELDGTPYVVCKNQSERKKIKMKFPSVFSKFPNVKKK